MTTTPTDPTPGAATDAPRLSLATLDAAASRTAVARTAGSRTAASHTGAPAWTPPAVDPREVEVGIVHLGLGAFHRAHQAVHTEDAAAATGETRWGILGVTQRSARVAEQLAPQDGLYGVLTKGRDTASLRVIGSLRGVAFPGAQTPEVLDRLAAPTTHVVSLTVTEKGYRRAPGGGPDLDDAGTQGDLAALAAELGAPGAGAADARPAATSTGLLVRGLARRHATSGAPVTVVCCDNMVDNGAQVRRIVTGLLDATPGAEALRAWVEESVRFPGTMVDRIVPATTEEHRAQARGILGLRDEGLVVGEPFTQWVIEDDFAGPRPAWERAGATLTGDVAPYERAKLRVLNATHSTLAYLGALHGYRTIAEAVQDPALEQVARALIDEDVLPTLTPPDGLDLHAYRDSVLERFANPSTGHTTIQVAMDGSQKLPFRLLATAADRLAAGAVPHAVARAVAAWVVFVQRGASVTGDALPLDDPLADVLRAAAAGPEDGLADRMLDLRAVFPAEVGDSPEMRAAVRAAVRELLADVREA